MALKDWIRISGRDAWKNIKTNKEVYIVNLMRQEGVQGWEVVTFSDSKIYRLKSDAIIFAKNYMEAN